MKATSERPGLILGGDDMTRPLAVVAALLAFVAPAPVVAGTRQFGAVGSRKFGISLLDPALTGGAGTALVYVSGISLAVLIAALYSFQNTANPAKVALMVVGALASLPIATLVLLWYLPVRTAPVNIALRVALLALAFGAAPPFFINDADGTLSDGLSVVVAVSRVLFALIVAGVILRAPDKEPAKRVRRHQGA